MRSHFSIGLLTLLCIANVAAGACDLVVDDLTARAKSGKVQLSWTDVGADLYNVYRKVEDGEYAWLASSAFSTYLDLDVVNGTTYTYYVTCECEGQEGMPSNEVSATPQSRPRRCDLVVDDLAARAKSGKVQLTWTDVGADLYNVYRKVEDGEYAWLASTTSTYSTYLDLDVVNGTTYTYYVACKCEGSEGIPSNEVSATPVARRRR